MSHDRAKLRAALVRNAIVRSSVAHVESRLPAVAVPLASLRPASLPADWRVWSDPSPRPPASEAAAGRRAAAGPPPQRTPVWLCQQASAQGSGTARCAHINLVQIVYRSYGTLKLTATVKAFKTKKTVISCKLFKIQN